MFSPCFRDNNNMLVDLFSIHQNLNQMYAIVIDLEAIVVNGIGTSV